MPLETNSASTEQSAERQLYLARVAASEVLAGRPALVSLLRYLAEAGERAGAAVTESDIARDMMGKGDDFDPRRDSSVRVQVARLRKHLAMYYEKEGQRDAVLFEIPKGEYRLHAHPRQLDQPDVVVPPPAPRPLPKLALGFGLVAVACGAAGFLIGSAKTEPSLTPALATLWNPFLNADAPPLVVYTNLRMAGDLTNGLRWFDATRDKPEDAVERFAAVGTVSATVALCRLWRPGQPWTVRRNGTFAWDQARRQSIVSLGARLYPGEVLRQRFVPDFVEPHKPATVRILDQDAGPTPVFYGARYQPGTQQIVEDHASISFSQSASGEWIARLGGCTTFGVWAAAEETTSEDRASALLARVGVPPGRLEPFEAVLRVTVVRDVPIRSEVVAVHRGAWTAKSGTRAQ